MIAYVVEKGEEIEEERVKYVVGEWKEIERDRKNSSYVMVSFFLNYIWMQGYRCGKWNR